MPADKELEGGTRTIHRRSFLETRPTGSANAGSLALVGSKPPADSFL